MTRKLSRRDFLKTAGAATLAVAAMGTLTACGGGGGSAPAPTTPVADKTLNNLKLADAQGKIVYSVAADDPTETPTDWAATMQVTLENTSDKEVELNLNNANILLDGKAPSSDKISGWIADENDAHRWHSMSSPSVKVVKGKTVTVRIKVKIDKTVYEQWKNSEGNHSLAITLKYDGKKVTYTLDSQRKTTVSEVTNA